MLAKGKQNKVLKKSEKPVIWESEDQRKKVLDEYNFETLQILSGLSEDSVLNVLLCYDPSTSNSPFSKNKNNNYINTFNTNNTKTSTSNSIASDSLIDPEEQIIDLTNLIQTNDKGEGVSKGDL